MAVKLLILLKFRPEMASSFGIASAFILNFGFLLAKSSNYIIAKSIKLFQNL